MKKIVTEFCIVCCSYKSTGLIENPVCITVSLLIFLTHICCLKHINSITQIYYCMISYLSICVFVGEKEWGSGEEGDPELEIWCGKPRFWLTTVPQLRCCLHTGINVCALYLPHWSLLWDMFRRTAERELLGSRVSTSELWAPASRGRHCLSHRCPLPPQRACSARSAVHTLQGRPRCCFSLDH